MAVSSIPISSDSSLILPNPVRAPVHDSGFLGAFIYTDHCRDHCTSHHTRLQELDQLMNSLPLAYSPTIKQYDQHNLETEI